uniref:NADH-ubiquinone oxidoreductase chain 3 n=1 Tax=Pediacus taiwanensis TaxID=2528278 RepID=A0A7G7MTP4_9CUCU|nr:NADH dehydrogenase subunit 3 [Pediacus taiwanensis]
MMMMLTMSIMLTMLIMMMMIMLNLISKKTFHDREKSSPFECGFDPKTSARLPFSLHFFLIAIIFLIFDVEITLLLPMVMIIKSSNYQNYFLIFFFFIVFLLLGTYHEWNQKSLNWIY